MTPRRWSAQNLPNLHGRTAVVTGANSGIGFHASVELAHHGARVIMACRSPSRGDRALATLRARVPSARAEVRHLDLADLASVREFACAVRAAHPSVHILINNGGLMAPRQRRESADHHELQFATNHLGHFALTGLLLPSLRGSRVVTVTSQMHRMGRIDLTDLDSSTSYGSWAAYSQSKLANLLFTMQLQRLADQNGFPVVSVAAHPGFAATALVSNGPGGRDPVGRAVDVLTRLVAQPAREGALPILYAACEPDVRGAELFGPGAMAGTRGRPSRTTASRAAYDPELAASLWERSEQMTGVHYVFADSAAHGPSADGSPAAESAAGASVHECHSSA